MIMLVKNLSLWQVAQIAQMHYQTALPPENENATGVTGHLPSKAAMRPLRLHSLQAAAGQYQAHPGAWQTTLSAPHSKSEPQVDS